MNLDVNHWKKRFLYPYANIQPIPDIHGTTLEEGDHQGAMNKSDMNFNKLVSKKYQFPIEKIMELEERLKELQQPLNIKADLIMRDVYKFVESFPIDLIPHMNEQEI